MKKKHLFMPLITLITAALVLSGCGNKPTEESTPDQTTGSNTEQTTPVEPTPPAEETPTQTTKSWDNPPAMEIDSTKSYEAEVTTNKGTFTIELYAKDAPKTVNNFVFLAKQGFYDDVIFHRIIESFMIQTGDPQGTGAGGPGYQFEDEKTSYQYEPGVVAMANAGANTNGSQFFICTGADSTSLNNQPNYTIFGKITNGMDVVKQIAATPVEVGMSGEMSTPTEKIQIKNVKITEK
ncbi:peptidylprolyl isomerase [Paenibacillus antarcticus]|uniref:Peptidyl-prolyl cis-trans isomerase n=1 Tax=Paenibacillus antarcticus TaxID=253703 RepID=A0A168NGP3_9BACL|nr:peptidylprolyl isomerase [Paenibacillus antarcticus]OAB45783.1 peptidylprolyl isomerase [Paenibacillus antarcticus]